MKKEYLFGLLRIAIGWILFWAGLDKIFGLGYATKAGKAWIDGVSPTAGYLKSVHGPFASTFHSMAGNPLVDWLFILGLLFAGIGFLLGTHMKLSAYVGSVLMFLIWLSVMPIKTNPFIDEHIIYILVLLTLASVGAGQYLGLEKWWKNHNFVKKHPILE